MRLDNAIGWLRNRLRSEERWDGPYNIECFLNWLIELRDIRKAQDNCSDYIRRSDALDAMRHAAHWLDAESKIKNLPRVRPEKPRLYTISDFEDNPDVDIEGYLPCWVEPNPKSDAGCEKPGWGLVRAGQIGGHYHRHWNGRPTQDQMDETPW